MSQKTKLSPAEKARQREKKQVRQTLLGAVALVVVIALVIGAVLVAQNTGLTLRKTAVTTTTRTADKGALTFYFNQYLSDYVNERLYYIQNGYLDLKLDTALDKQTYDGEHTWYSYFAGKAAENIRRDMLLCDAADAAGMTLDAAEQAAVAAEAAAIRPGDYGKGLRAADVQTCLEMQALADKYLRSIEGELYGTPADWAQRYDENLTTYRTVDFLSIELQTTLNTKEDADQYDTLLNAAMNSKNPTDFQAYARRIMLQYGGMTEEQADSRLASSVQNSQAYYDSGDLMTWLFADDTQLYDTYIEETTSSCTITMITRLKGKDTGLTANYQSISFLTASYQSAAEAQAAAQAALDKWNAGEQTEAAFAALGTDGTYTAYSNVFNGRMETAVNSWLFDGSRQPGDVTLLETASGYQLLRYAGTGIERWQIKVRSDLYDARYTQRLSDWEKDYQYAIRDDVLQSIRPKMALKPQ